MNTNPFTPSRSSDDFIKEYGPGTLVQGAITTSKNGTGYLKVINDLEEVIVDLPIPRDFLAHAFHGDTIQGIVADDLFFGRPYIKVISIIEKGNRFFIGTVTSGPGNSLFFRANDTKTYTDIYIPERNTNGAHIGDKVRVECIEWNNDDKSPIGTVTHVYGKSGDNEAEMMAILSSRGIDYSFPKTVITEAQQIKDAEETYFKQAISDSYRKDIRSLLTFTIDPVDAKDFDDALSCECNEDGTYTIGVHIADVSHYVSPFSDLDNEARKREFSTYLVDRTIPMLPEVLSNDLCSLNPHTDKLTFSGLFTLDSQGNIIKKWFGKTIIHSDKRFTYEEAQEIIDTKSGEYFNELEALNNISKALKKKRFDGGALEFSDVEIKFELDEYGKPIRVYQKERFDAHKLVEEFMLLHNRLVAEEIEIIKEKQNTSLPFMYRTHDNPDRERLESLSVFLTAIGFDIQQITHGKDISEPESINAIIEHAKGTHLEALVSTEMLRSMAKAKYTISNPKHFGLGFSYYCHFTSPIRRYPDLIAHRLFNRYLHGESIKQGEWQQLEAIAQVASEREVEVVDAERESIKLKQVEYLSNNIGNVVTGIISGLSESGIFVEEKETKANGLIRFKTMSDDTYTLDRKQYCAIGAKTKKVLRLGDELTLIVTKTDLELKQVDFEIVEKKSIE